MADFNYEVKKGDLGLTYIFLNKAKDLGYQGDNKKVNWNAVMSIFDKIQQEEKTQGEQLYSGGNDKTRAGWGNSYVIKAGDKISLSESQLDEIYEAMGFTKTTTPAAPPAPTAPPTPTLPAVQTPPVPQTLPTAAQTIPTDIQPPSFAELYNPDLAGTALLKPDGSTVEYNSSGAMSRVFDSSGNKIRYVSYLSDDSVNFFIDYEYDASGNQTREVSYNPDGSVSGFKDYEYDASGNHTRTVGYNPDGSVDFFIDYEYDPSGNKTRKVSYNSDGSVRYFVDYEYDPSGNQTRVVNYNSDGSVNFFIDYEYDPSGNKTREVDYNSDGSVNYSTDY